MYKVGFLNSFPESDNFSLGYYQRGHGNSKYTSSMRMRWIPCIPSTLKPKRYNCGVMVDVTNWTILTLQSHLKRDLGQIHATVNGQQYKGRLKRFT